MADDIFPAVTTVTDVGVRDISVELFRGNDGTQTARFNIQVLRSDGSIVVRSGNLIPHLTGTEITGLQTLMNRIRTKARAAWGNG